LVLSLDERSGANPKDGNHPIIYFAMKTIFFFLVLLLSCEIAFAQHFINPIELSQSGDIILQDTDVYYNPYAPPAATDVRDSLSCVYSIIADPNLLGDGNNYQPQTHDTALRDWHPHGTPLGNYASWQRLFTAKRKANGSASDIIVGDSVTNDTPHVSMVRVSKNEDVDFRASGKIRMEHGFHVMPGAFFHAYIEPKWETTVFSDEFDSSALDRSKWSVGRGWDEGMNNGAQCSSDSNLWTTVDSEAHDGHALEIILREMPGTSTCSCLDYDYKTNDNCLGFLPPDSLVHHFKFSAAALRTCPWGWQAADTPYAPAYQHAPYGKYEIREKIPHIKHHTNNWGANRFEWDVNETWNGNMSEIRPSIGMIRREYGPFQGTFGPHSGTDPTIVFRSPEAHFSNVNRVVTLNIDGFSYAVDANYEATDTFLTPGGTTTHFPSSLAHSTAPLTFRYQRWEDNTTDTLTWTVDTTGRIFYAPYRIGAGDTLFTRTYQPTSVTLTVKVPPLTRRTIKCHWEHTLNSPTNLGLIYLDEPLGDTDLHTFREPYSYSRNETVDYAKPPVRFNGDDTVGGYEYHTFAFEMFPHEARMLIDGNVVSRFPDRLIPTENTAYDFITKIQRFPTYIYPAQFEIDRDPTDTLGTTPGTVTYRQRQYFETHLTNPGMWDVEIPPHSGHWYHAAHHLIDYVKVWDVPASTKIADYPQ
jgi:hypothetical protein